MSVTKADLINKVHSSNHELTRVKAHQAVETILDLIKTRLENGENVLISGFGKFNVRHKSSRKGRNPQTGETMMLEPRRVVVFKASGTLRKAVNKS